MLQIGDQLTGATPLGRVPRKSRFSHRHHRRPNRNLWLASQRGDDCGPNPPIGPEPVGGGCREPNPFVELSCLRQQESTRRASFCKFEERLVYLKPSFIVLKSSDRGPHVASHSREERDLGHEDVNGRPGGRISLTIRVRGHHNTPDPTGNACESTKRAIRFREEAGLLEPSREKEDGFGSTTASELSIQRQRLAALAEMP